MTAIMASRRAPGLRAVVSLALSLLSLVVAAGRVEAQATPAEIARGKYVFGATGGCGCHTDKGKDKPVNAGGRQIDAPFGTVFSTNITPDRDTGIGAWTDGVIYWYE